MRYLYNGPMYFNIIEMLKSISLVFILVLFFLLVSPVSAKAESNVALRSLKAEILEIEERTVEMFGTEIEAEVFTVKLETDEEVEIVYLPRPELATIEFEVGDDVIVDESTIDGEVNYVITDFQRTDYLFLLLFIFIGLVVLISRKQGVFSLLSLGLSYFLIFQVMIKQILDGMNSLLAAILISLLIIPINYFIGHSLNRKTAYAAGSSLITLVIIGLFATVIVDAANLTGFTSDEAGFLSQLTNGEVNVKDLLLAGIIIGMLGILDDITISQASIANQIKSANKKMGFNELFSRTISVGRDHISSLVNTLILVYTSTSLPLLILIEGSESSILTTLNREVIMEELVIMLITSNGLILAVPITTYISCLFITKYGPEDVHDAHDDHHHHHGHAH